MVQHSPTKRQIKYDRLLSIRKNAKEHFRIKNKNKKPKDEGVCRGKLKQSFNKNITAGCNKDNAEDIFRDVLDVMDK